MASVSTTVTTTASTVFPSTPSATTAKTATTAKVIRPKRKHVAVSVEEKAKVLKKIKDGENPKTLADELGVSFQTVRDWLKNSDNILKFCAEVENSEIPSRRKSLTKSRNDKVDEALHKWYQQARLKNMPITGPLLMEKALELNKDLGGPSDFRASHGFLTNFKSRHGIQLGNHSGMKRIAKRASLDKYKASFLMDMEREGLTPEQVYCADETSIYWKRLPSKSMISVHERNTVGNMFSKEYVTVLCCANAAGTHRHKPLVVGKETFMGEFKHTDVRNLPVYLACNKKGWMTAKLFTEWFKDIFVPDVQKYLRSKDRKECAVLLIDTAPFHPIGILSTEDENFTVFLLPPKISNTIQPMVQGVFQALKARYMRILLSKMYSVEDNFENLVQFWKSYSFKDAIVNISKAWKEILPVTLNRGWKNLWAAVVTDVVEVQDAEVFTPEEISNTKLMELMRNLSGFENVDEDNLKELLRVGVLDTYSEEDDGQTVDEYGSEDSSIIVHEEPDEVKLERDISLARESYQGIVKLISFIIKHGNRDVEKKVLQLQSFQDEVLDFIREKKGQRMLDYYRYMTYFAPQQSMGPAPPPTDMQASTSAAAVATVPPYDYPVM